jgi:tetratricopeptide (TPR) repeat protein
VAALNAARRTEQPIWHHRDIIGRCVANLEAAQSDRLRAARIYLLVAEEQLDATAALELNASILTQFPFDIATAAWQHYLLTYHGTFGSLDTAALVAREILTRRASADPPSLSAVNQSAFVLFRYGEPRTGYNHYRELVASSKKARIESHAVSQYAAQLAMMLIHDGNYDEAQHYNDIAVESITAAGWPHTGGILSNQIDLALARGDGPGANALLGLLRGEYSAKFTPNRERTAIGHELLIAAALDARTPMQTLASAQLIFSAGAALSEADTLACGIAIAHARLGETERAKNIINSYCGSLRRDRYPLAPHLRNQLFAHSVPIPECKSAVSGDTPPRHNT